MNLPYSGYESDDPRTHGWYEGASGSDDEPTYIPPFDEADPRTHFGWNEPVKSSSKKTKRVKRKRTVKKRNIERLETIIKKLTECLSEAQMELHMQHGGTVPASYNKLPKLKRTPKVKKQDKINAIGNIYSKKKTKRKTRRRRRSTRQ
jgi:hypothetical protein